MSQYHIVHRDLKPENMLLDKDTDGLKIIDFGLSNLYDRPSDLLETACGSPCYAAPEMIAGKPYKGLDVDIWSCGIILYAMLCGYLPFEDPNTDKLYKKIIKCDYKIPHYISSEGKDLITKIMNTNPKERYKMSEIRAHEWFVKNTSKTGRTNSKLEELEMFSYPSSQDIQEIRINPSIIIDIVMNYKIPSKNHQGKHANGADVEAT